MAYVLPFAFQYTSGLDVGPATVAAIRRAFVRVQTTANTSPAAAVPLGLGNYVGPNPRVTRSVESLHLPGTRGDQLTRAAWLFELPDPHPSQPQAVQQQFRQDQIERLRNELLDNLRREAPDGAPGDEWQVSVFNYEADRHGPVEWWRSGAAATAATYINSWPTGLATADNPIGPNEAPQTPEIDLGLPHLPTGQQVGGWVKTAATWLAIGAAVFYLGPPLLSWGAGKAMDSLLKPSTGKSKSKRRRRSEG